MPGVLPVTHHSDYPDRGLESPTPSRTPTFTDVAESRFPESHATGEAPPLETSVSLLRRALRFPVTIGGVGERTDTSVTVI